MDAVSQAADRIWLVDPFLLKVNDEVQATFSMVFKDALIRTRAQNIRLLTEGKIGHTDQIAQLKNLERYRQEHDNPSFKIDITIIRDSKSFVRLPHDRFAIIDDELWHWGANVGGTHHLVNAYSRGWSARRTQADRYFDRLWKYAGSINREMA
ncbi:hypothetical protein ACO2RV_24895 [Ancylobacter sp. VNQ12]|uniref:hypothetical protein n=1 Tax=Ancylobacter sp. VNQ12 TaxID=3400920 RepID=UPI003C0E44EF